MDGWKKVSSWEDYKEFAGKYIVERPTPDPVTEKELYLLDRGCVAFVAHAPSPWEEAGMGAGIGYNLYFVTRKTWIAGNHARTTSEILRVRDREVRALTAEELQVLRDSHEREEFRTEYYPAGTLAT